MGWKVEMLSNGLQGWTLHGIKKGKKLDFFDRILYPDFNV